VQVAVLIDGYRTVLAYIDLAYGLVLQVDADASTLGLYVHEGDVMLVEHGVMHTAYLYTQNTVAQICHHRKVLLYTRLDGAGYQLFHLLSATEYGYLVIDYFLYYIATMGALIKFGCHNLLSF
jgi:hypothetical protein